jgi:hypothetical protein
MARVHHIVRALAASTLATTALVACSSNDGGPGLKVTVDLANFAGHVDSMTITISADPSGFDSHMDDNVKGIGLSLEDVDGNGTLELIAEFLKPHPTESFRVQTDNRAMLTMNASAMAFDKNDLIASATGAATPLAPGGESAIALRLEMDMPGPIGANTRTTDLGTAATDVAVWGRAANVNMSSLAVCDVDGDGAEDIVVGAPGDTDGTLAATGAVYIVWGGWPSQATVDLAQQNAKATVFYGTGIGEHLGGAIACVDLDGDTIGDVIAGAPGADGGRGRIYAVFGRPMFRANRPVNLASASTGADIVWTTTSSAARLGSALFAVGKSRGIVPLILASAPGALVTHLFANVTLGTATAPKMIDAGAADHPTFTGVAATALAAGSLDEAPDSGKPLDIALGDPTYRDQSDTAATRGRVYLFSDVALTGTAPIDVASAAPTITGMSLNSQLGTALLIADTSGGGEDLFVGAPGDGGTGAVYIFKHATGLLLPPTLSTTNTDTTVAIAGDDPAGLFGSALASTRAGSTSAVALRLAVGAPNVSRGSDRVGIGAAYLYTADTDRKFRIFEKVYGKDAGDALGTAVAGGQLNGSDAQEGSDQIGDLVAAAPSARGSDAGTGVVYVRYGRAGRQ